MFWIFGRKSCGILALWRGMEPAPPVLGHLGEVSTFKFIYELSSSAKIRGVGTFRDFTETIRSMRILSPLKWTHLSYHKYQVEWDTLYHNYLVRSFQVKLGDWYIGVCE